MLSRPTKETINLINKETVEYFPKGAVITNVARGDIVDDEALIDALNRRKIYAAGLDVYKGEPKFKPRLPKNKNCFYFTTPWKCHKRYQNRNGKSRDR